MISRRFPRTWFNPKKFEIKGLVAPIAFDMDSVLNEGGQLLREAVARHFGQPIGNILNIDPEHGYEKFHFNVLGASNTEVFDVVNMIIGRDSLSYQVTPHMRSILSWVWKHTGRPITVVTARHPDNMRVTYEWLKMQLGSVPFYLIMVNGMHKEVVLNRIDNRLFIDDRYKTIKTLEKHIEYPVLYKRPWNQGRPEQAGVAEVDDLSGLLNLIFLLEEYNAKL